MLQNLREKQLKMKSVRLTVTNRDSSRLFRCVDKDDFFFLPNEKLGVDYKGRDKEQRWGGKMSKWRKGAAADNCN